MEGKIDRDGWFYIKRVDNFVPCECVNASPVLKYDKIFNRVCSHSCPAFREPVTSDEIQYFDDCDRSYAVKPGKTIIRLCAEVGTLVFDKFTDER